MTGQNGVYAWMSGEEDMMDEELDDDVDGDESSNDAAVDGLPSKIYWIGIALLAAASLEIWYGQASLIGLMLATLGIVLGITWILIEVKE